VSAFCKCLTPLQIVQHVIPCVRELSMDSSQYVRAALASVVMELAPVMGKQHTIEHLVPVFLTLLKDQYPDVRLNVISKLDQVNQVRRPCCPLVAAETLPSRWVSLLLVHVLCLCRSSALSCLHSHCCQLLRS
jgi:hypothetical protein